MEREGTAAMDGEVGAEHRQRTLSPAQVSLRHESASPSGVASQSRQDHQQHHHSASSSGFFNRSSISGLVMSVGGAAASSSSFASPGSAPLPVGASASNPSSAGSSPAPNASFNGTASYFSGGNVGNGLPSRAGHRTTGLRGSSSATSLSFHHNGAGGSILGGGNGHGLSAANGGVNNSTLTNGIGGHSGSVLPHRPHSETIPVQYLSSEAEAIDRWFEDLSNYEQTLEEMSTTKVTLSFRTEMEAVEQWFVSSLNDCERTTALYTLLHHCTQLQIRFLLQVLQRMARKDPMAAILAPIADLDRMEDKDAGMASSSAAAAAATATLRDSKGADLAADNGRGLTSLLSLRPSSSRANRRLYDRHSTPDPSTLPSLSAQSISAAVVNGANPPAGQGRTRDSTGSSTGAAAAAAVASHASSSASLQWHRHSYDPQSGILEQEDEEGSASGTNSEAAVPRTSANNGLVNGGLYNSLNRHSSHHPQTQHQQQQQQQQQQHNQQHQQLARLGSASSESSPVRNGRPPSLTISNINNGGQERRFSPASSPLHLANAYSSDTGGTRGEHQINHGRFSSLASSRSSSSNSSATGIEVNGGYHASTSTASPNAAGNPPEAYTAGLGLNGHQQQHLSRPVGSYSQGYRADSGMEDVSLLANGLAPSAVNDGLLHPHMSSPHSSLSLSSLSSSSSSSSSAPLVYNSSALGSTGMTGINGLGASGGVVGSNVPLLHQQLHHLNQQHQQQQHYGHGSAAMGPEVFSGAMMMAMGISTVPAGHVSTGLGSPRSSVAAYSSNSGSSSSGSTSSSAGAAPSSGPGLAVFSSSVYAGTAMASPLEFQSPSASPSMSSLSSSHRRTHAQRSRIVSSERAVGGGVSSGDEVNQSLSAEDSDEVGFAGEPGVDANGFLTSSSSPSAMASGGAMRSPLLATGWESIKDISGWLRSQRLHKYTPLFEGMDWRVMLDLTDEKLQEVGVAALGARRKLLKSFETVKQEMELAEAESSSAEKERADS